MGGHGGLNILPQKKWNVYNWDNRLKVEQDEQKAREKKEREEEAQARTQLNQNYKILKRRAGIDESDPAPRKQVEDKREVKQQQFNLFDKAAKHWNKKRLSDQDDTFKTVLRKRLQPWYKELPSDLDSELNRIPKSKKKLKVEKEATKKVGYQVVNSGKFFEQVSLIHGEFREKGGSGRFKRSKDRKREILESGVASGADFMGRGAEFLFGDEKDSEILKLKKKLIKEKKRRKKAEKKMKKERKGKKDKEGKEKKKRKSKRDKKRKKKKKSKRYEDSEKRGKRRESEADMTSVSSTGRSSDHEFKVPGLTEDQALQSRARRGEEEQRKRDKLRKLREERLMRERRESLREKEIMYI